MPEDVYNCLRISVIVYGSLYTAFLLGIFFRGGRNLLLCKFLLLFYCFRTKFQGGAKVFRGAPPAPSPVEESQYIYMSGDVHGCLRISKVEFSSILAKIFLYRGHEFFFAQVMNNDKTF